MVNALVEPAFVSLAREVVKTRTAKYVNNHDCTPVEDQNSEDENCCEGVTILDMQSANLIVTIYDALGNKASFEERMKKLGLAEFTHRLWRMVK